MAVYVDSILFNIDPAIGTGSINLREDAFRSVTLPEWPNGTAGPERSPAAYAISQIQPGSLLLQLSIWKDQDEETVWLKAVDDSPDRSNLLGEIQEFRIEFLDRQHRYLAVPIPTPRLLAVDRHDDVWRWEYRTSLGRCGVAAISRHRIYSLLDRPHSPWDATSGNSYLWPWRQVLDVACEWAKGATDTTEAANRIGRRIYALGQPVNGKRLFRYDIRDTTETLADDTFDCIEFLRTVQGRPFAIHKACCSDFASMLVTVANALGCNLSNLTLLMRDGSKFLTNPVKGVGGPRFENPFQFRFHEVAITGEPGPEARVWDSCFLVGDGNPVEIPNYPREALNMRFGGPGEQGYLDRLVQPSFRPEIVPKIEAPNRSVTPLVEPAEIRSGISGIGPLAPHPVLPQEKIFTAGLFLAGIQFQGRMLRRLSFPRLTNKDTVIDSYWESTAKSEVLIRLRVEIEDTIREAQDRVIQWGHRAAASLNLPGQLSPATEVVILTAIGNLAIEGQNVGFDDEDLAGLHNELRVLFADKPQPNTDEGSFQLHPPFRTDVPIPFKTCDGSVWFKLFTFTGDLFAQGNDVFYKPGPGSNHEIEVYEMSGMRAVRRYAYEFHLP